MIYKAHRDGAMLIFLQEYGICLGVQGSGFLVDAASQESHTAIILIEIQQK